MHVADSGWDKCMYVVDTSLAVIMITYICNRHQLGNASVSSRYQLGSYYDYIYVIDTSWEMPLLVVDTSLAVIMIIYSVRPKTWPPG